MDRWNELTGGPETRSHALIRTRNTPQISGAGETGPARLMSRVACHVLTALVSALACTSAIRCQGPPLGRLRCSRPASGTSTPVRAWRRRRRPGRGAPRSERPVEHRRSRLARRCMRGAELVTSRNSLSRIRPVAGVGAIAPTRRLARQDPARYHRQRPDRRTAVSSHPDWHYRGAAPGVGSTRSSLVQPVQPRRFSSSISRRAGGTVSNASVSISLTSGDSISVSST